MRKIIDRLVQAAAIVATLAAFAAPALADKWTDAGWHTPRPGKTWEDCVWSTDHKKIVDCLQQVDIETSREQQPAYDNQPPRYADQQVYTCNGPYGPYYVHDSRDCPAQPQVVYYARPPLWASAPPFFGWGGHWHSGHHR